MIIINLKGGLGNQMFQYAFGRKLSITTKTKFKLNKSGYEHDTFRSYSLNVFNTIENFASEEEINKFDASKQKINLFKRICRSIEFRILKNYHIGWEPRFIKKIIKKISRGITIYLDGYWQSYKYFEDIRDILIKDFSLKIPLRETNFELLSRVDSVNSVSLAVRRTDYLSPQSLKDFGVCSADYYEKAIKLIEGKVDNPVFFIICDDLEWVRNNIDFKNHPVTYVSELRAANSIRDYQEMILMSKCKHNVVANSSFSWWPAWLNENPNKIVIAPDVWFTDGSIKIDDIIPPTWIKLPRN